MTKGDCPLRILVVEDELMVAMGLEMVLKEAGYTVIGPVGRLEQAMKAAASEGIDFALLDVNVRGQEVYPVADILIDRGIPFAFLTGYGKETIPDDRSGTPLLSKPFKADALLAAVKRLI